MGYAATVGFDVEVETLAHGVVQNAGGALIQVASSMVASREEAVTVELYGERGTGGWTNRPSPTAWFRGVRARGQKPPGGGPDALRRSLAGLARWVLDDEPFLTPARGTLAVLAAVDAIYRSARTGIREPVVDAGEADEWQQDRNDRRSCRRSAFRPRGVTTHRAAGNASPENLTVFVGIASGSLVH